MIHCNLSLCSSLSYPHNPIISTKYIYCAAQPKPAKNAKTPSNLDSLSPTNMQESKLNKQRAGAFSKLGCNKLCLCGRRGFIGATLLPILDQPSYAAFNLDTPTDPTNMLNRIHPPRPDWYEEFYASAMNSTMESYEAEIAGYKSKIFSNLRKNSNKILELGIGTGPNLKYYASNSVDVVGIDPNQKMEKYAKAAAVSIGLPSDKFKFIRAVGEALPIEDASIDAVVGTLVLCSVEDVNATLQEVRRVLKPGGIYLFVEHVAAEDGTILKFVQGILDPLQQTVADGCHLSRNTGASISAAGFSSVNMNMVFLPALSIIGPHVYGSARK